MDLLGPQRDWLNSNNGCSYNPDPTGPLSGDCGKPSAVHLRLAGDDGYASACADHRAFALAALTWVEYHAWMAWCNMPGALWHPSPTPDEADSWCSLDETDDASSRAREAELDRRAGEHTEVCR